MYEVNTYHESRDHRFAQCEVMSYCYKNGIKAKWLSSCFRPKNWNGYDKDNPSPGYDIYYHTWKVENELDAISLKLRFGERK